MHNAGPSATGGVPNTEVRTIDQWLAEAASAEADNRLEDAERILSRVVEAAPEYVPALSQTAILKYRLKKASEALGLFERAAALAPDIAFLRRNLCEIYRSQSRLDEALEHGRRAIELAPDDADGYYNLGVLHYDRMEIDEAIRLARRALEIQPDMAAAHFELSESLLLNSEFEEGWQEYEWRFDLPNSPRLLPHQDKPQWDGKPMPDGTLLLIADQGFGDTIQFCRYIRQVAEICPRIIVACSSEMLPVVSQQPGITAFFDRWENVPSFDAYCPLSGLPRLFATRLDNIPASIPYVKPDSGKVRRWQERLAALVPSGYRTIGVVWAGRPTHGNDFNRSMSLAQMAPFADLSDTALISLQIGPAASQISGYYGQAPLINLGPEIEDFADTMAILANLDHLVSVDTSVVHLAGALGRPVSVMLPFAPDWRWLRERSDTPWYPSVELFRQTRNNDWQDCIASISARLDGVGKRGRT